MKLLFDLLPVVVFFGAFRIAKSLPDATLGLVTAWFGAVTAPAELQGELCAIILASASAIVATVLQVGWLLARRRRIKPAVWISAAVVIVFGGLTVWLHNEWFIKWKPSILYWIFAAMLLGGKLIWRRNLLGSLLSEELQLPDAVWDRLLYAWVAFFVLLGGANLAAAYAWSTTSWVNFKTFGLLGLTLAFSLATGLYMARYLTAGAKTGASPESDA